MPKLVIINGAPGIGKTTVAEIVFSKLSNSAIEDDQTLDENAVSAVDKERLAA